MEQKVENRNLSKALEIVSKLIVGEEISRDSKETASLYDEYIYFPIVIPIIIAAKI